MTVQEALRNVPLSEQMAVLVAIAVAYHAMKNDKALAAKMTELYGDRAIARIEDLALEYGHG